MLVILIIFPCKHFIKTCKKQGSIWFFDFLRRFEQSDLRADLRDLVIRSNLALGIAFFYIRSLRHSKISCGFKKNYALLNPLAVAVQISLSQVTQKNMWGNTRSIQELNRIQQWGRTHLISCTDGEYTSLETEACLIDSMSQRDKRCVALISGNTDFIRTCPYGGDLQKRIMIHQGNPFAF